MNAILAGLQLQNQRMDVSAHNVANVMTQGFQASQVVAQELPGGGARGTVVSGSKGSTKKVSEDPADYVGSAAFLESDTDLIRETVTQITAAAAYRANAKALRAHDEVLDDLAHLGT